MPKTKIRSSAESLLSKWLRLTSETLGLERQVDSAVELAAIVHGGLEPASVERLLQLGVSERLMFDNVIPRRTYQRRRNSGQKLTPDESDRVERVARLFSLANLVFEDTAKAVHWLDTPKQQFEERAPFEIAASSIGAKAVEDVLLRAYYGFSA